MRYLTWIAGALLIIAGIVALASPVFANRYGWHGYGWHGYHRGGFGLAFLAHQLDLSDAQKTQIKSTWEAERPAVLPLLHQLADGHKQMSAATADGTFEEARVRTIAAQQAQTVAQLLVEKERLQAKIYSTVLTPEQRLKADHMRARMNDRIDSFLNSMEHSSD